MKFSHQQNDEKVTVFLDGELDHHEAMKAMKYITNIIDMYAPNDLQLDLSRLSFMDSSGIAVVLSGFKQMKSSGGNFSVSGMPAQSRKVLCAAGIDKIVTII